MIKSGGYAAAALGAAKQIPPLTHHTGRAEGSPFNQADSEVIAHLVALPAVRLFIFRAMVASGAIVFDRVRRTWAGADYRGGAS